MFINFRSMNSEAAETGATMSTDAGGWTIDNSEPETAPEVVIDDSDEFPAYQNEEEIPENSTGEDSASGTEAASDTQTPSSEPFKEYSFKGKVNGEETTQTFKTQKELDRTIARGILAPKIHEAYVNLQAESSEWKKSHEWAVAVDELAKKEPARFFSEVVMGYLESADEAEAKAYEAALVDFVHDRATHYTKLASMPEEQLKAYRQQQTAEKILRDHARLQELAQENERKAEEARKAKDAAEFEGWKQRELNSWFSKVADSDRETVQSYLDIVTNYAYAQLSQGKKYDWKDMSDHLAKLCDPLVRLRSVQPAQSPTQKKQEELAQNQQRAQQNKEKLRNQAGNPNSTRPKLTGAELQKGAIAHLAKKFFNQ